MILSRHNTLLFLLNHGLLTVRDLVTQSIAVRSHSQRNRGFSVTWPNGHGYYVKQHQPDAGPWEPHSTVACEAHLLQRFSHTSAIQTWVPQLRYYDAPRQALVIDWLPHATPCQQAVLVNDLPDPTAAYGLGRALAQLHRALADLALDNGKGLAISAQPPWPLTFHKLHPLVSEDQSWGQAQLVALVQQQQDVMAALADLAANWPTSQLIHGDMKWQNCLVTGDFTDPNPAEPCMFIDWEMAGLGDPLWDLAGLAQSYLKDWLDRLSIFNSDTRPEQAVQQSSKSLPPYQAALHQLWRAYLNHSLTSVSVERFMALCGARLIQTLYEDNTDEAMLNPAHTLLLQLARNLLLQPSNGAQHLLGAV